MPRSCDAILKEIHSWEELRKAAVPLTKKRKGDLFERLVQFFLELDPEYSQLREVWLYEEVPAGLKEELNLPEKDRGVDLLAKTHKGDYWAIQAKFRSDSSGSMTLGDLGTFGTQAAAVARGGPGGVVRGVICATKDDPTPDFAGAAGFDFHHVLINRWSNLDPEFWGRVRERARGEEATPLEPYEPRDYQRTAIEEAERHFAQEGARKGKLIMPCGTGKSLMGYWIATQALQGKAILVVVPSLDLLKQTFRVWAREAAATELRLDPLVVCSDESTAEGDIHVSDLAGQATTDPKEIRAWLKHSALGKTRVVFVTYQSGPVLAKAVGKFEFDVALLDEAHKTAGTVGKSFQHLLYQKNVRVKHRLFMTATERFYHGDLDEVVGMNDAKVYGKTFHTMTFGEAIGLGILADYAVVLLAVTQSEAEDYRELIEERRYVELARDEGGFEQQRPAITAEDLASAVALRKAMKRFGLTHGISFHARNRYAKDFASVQTSLNESGQWPRIKTFRVTGKDSAGKRGKELKAFECSKRALISNARCLTEGVDVPAIDLVLFAQPRQSKVDIVQAVGRALRTGDAKNKKGYVLVPVLVEDERQDLEKIVTGTGFENLVAVAKAMATVDGEVAERISISLAGKPRSGKRSRGQDGGATEFVPQEIDVFDLAEALKLRVWDRLEGLRKPRLTEDQILQWADEHRARTGKWPGGHTRPGPASEETWPAIEMALRSGVRGLPGGSSLALLLIARRDAVIHLHKADLTEGQILRWADEFRELTGRWPAGKSEPPPAEGESWPAIDGSLRVGNRGLPGGSSLARLLVEHRSADKQSYRQRLSTGLILGWADAHRARTRKWPKKATKGVIPESEGGETWARINNALVFGSRGLSGKSSLIQLLAAERGVRNPGALPPLVEEQILAWADHFHETRGEWPSKDSRPPPCKTASWAQIDSALLGGGRGLRGGSNLARLLFEKRDVRSHRYKPNLAEEDLLKWADAHRERTGQWPSHKSGVVQEAPEERWIDIERALRRGYRGLEGGRSLAKFLGEHRPLRNHLDLAALSEDEILKWADEFKRINKKLPTRTSGLIAGGPSGETWSTVSSALRLGVRGLPGGSSLAALLRARRGMVDHTNKPPLTESQILEWADAYHERTGKWPRVKSGPVGEDSSDTWSRLDNALRNGSRGLAGGSSIADLLSRERGVENPKRPRNVTPAQIRTWAEAWRSRTGAYPRNKDRAKEIPGSGGLKWSQINSALANGTRGLEGGSSLDRFLKEGDA